MNKSSIIVAHDRATLEKELASLIQEIVKGLVERSDEIELNLSRWIAEEDDLRKLASVADLRIRRQELELAKKNIRKILKSSTNRLIVSTIQELKN